MDLNKAYHWGPDWTKAAFGDPNEEYSGEKYADLALYDPTGKVIIPLGIDHYEVHIDGDGTPEGTISKATRELIVKALNAYKER